MKKKPQQQNLFAQVMPCAEYRRKTRMDPMLFKRPERKALYQHYLNCAACKEWTDEGGAEK